MSETNIPANNASTINLIENVNLCQVPDREETIAFASDCNRMFSFGDVHALKYGK